MRPPLNSAAIRRMNVVRVFHALRERPNCSQRELGLATGLDKATVSAVVAQLVEEGLVTRSLPARAGRVGRPETGLAINPSAGILVGARLEPAAIRIVTATLDGTLLDHLQIPGSRDVGRALDLLREGIARAVSSRAPGRPIRGIGVGIPGLMDRDGRLVLAPNLGWRDSPIQPLLQATLGAPVHVDNDTKAAALAERLFGTCRDVENFLYVTGHSGVGGGLFLDGRLYRGPMGFAGEIGHTTVVAGGRPCGCGKRGCLETYVSEAAILRQAEERGRPLADIAEVALAARAGDSAILALLAEAGSHLGQALGNAANLLNPSLIVLGGNLTVVAPWIMPALERTLADHTLGPVGGSMQVVVSPLGMDAVPIGGIALAMEGFLSAPAPAPLLQS